MTMVSYDAQTCDFYDELVTLLVSVSSLGYVTSKGLNNKGMPWGASDPVVTEGFHHVTNEEMQFYPIPILNSVIGNVWPSQVDIDFKQLSPGTGVRRIALGPMMERYAAGALQTYFERRKSHIGNKYGAQPSWPGVWNFGRVIRNTFSHGGLIDFRNKQAQPVSWKNLTYSPANNGSQVFAVDLTIVEIVRLMEDMALVV